MYRLLRKLALRYYWPLVGIVLWQCEFAKPTPQQYLNRTVVSDSLYTSDSLVFVNQMLSFIAKEESAYYPTRFDTITSTVFIDTILYSSDSRKAVFFSITRDANKNVLGTKDPDGYHYNARCFLALRDSVSKAWSVSWFRILNNSFYSDYEDISRRFRRRYFVELVSVKGEGDESRYKYNVNDVRFWDGPAWKKGPQMLEQNISGGGG